MKNKLLNKDFFQNLANIYYAMGMIDGKFVRLEKLKIIEIVNKNWKDSNPSINIEEIIYERLKELIDSKKDPKQAFELFSEYFISHEHLFTREIRDQILKDTYDIANSFAGRNKSELVLHYRIKQLFY